MKVESIKVLAEVCSLFFNMHEQTVSDDIRRQLRQFVENYFVDSWVTSRLTWSMFLTF